jgi:hypothetical protein
MRTNPRKPDASPSSTQGLGAIIDVLEFNMVVAHSYSGQHDAHNKAKDHNRNRMAGGGF